MKQVWHSLPVFISEVKKDNSTKTKNEDGDICFSINYKFLCKVSFKLISFFVSVVTLCDIFYSRFKRFFGKIDFSLKNKQRAFFSLFLCSFISK